MNAVKIVGANGARRANDFYPTPREVTLALCDWLERRGIKGIKVWEPACGEGHMVKVLQERGNVVCGTDIETGTDFLDAALPDGTDWIITNPPFFLAEQFIYKANSFCVPFALLLKCQYWHSAKRKLLFDKIRPSYILPLTWRPDFTGQGNSLMDMMWVVWLNEQPCLYPFYQPLARPKKEDEDGD